MKFYPDLSQHPFMRSGWGKKWPPSPLHLWPRHKEFSFPCIQNGWFLKAANSIIFHHETPSRNLILLSVFAIWDLLASSIPVFMANFPDLITESDNPACQHLIIQTPSGWKPIHKPNCCKFQFYAQVYTCYFFVSSTTVTDCNCFASIHSNAEAKLCSEEAVEGTPKGLMQSLQGVVQSLCSSMWAMLREALEISTVPEQDQTKHLPTYVPSLTYSLPTLPPSFLENWKLDVLDKINLVLNGYTEEITAFCLNEKTSAH